MDTYPRSDTYRTRVHGTLLSALLAILERVPRNNGLVLLSSYLLKRVLYVCIEQQIFSVSAPNIRVCESESFSLLHCFSISNVPVFQIVGALIALAVNKKRKTCKSNAASTLVLVLELVRVFGFSLFNLSKSFSLDCLHWPLSGFAVSCK